MIPAWLTDLLAKIRLPGAGSSRLIACTVGAVLLAWLLHAIRTNSVPEIPGSVLVLVLLVIGTAALDRSAP